MITVWAAQTFGQKVYQTFGQIIDQKFGLFTVWSMTYTYQDMFKNLWLIIRIRNVKKYCGYLIYYLDLCIPSQISISYCEALYTIVGYDITYVHY